MPKDVIDVIDERIDHKNEPDKRATIVSINGRYARVKVNGSTQLRKARCDSAANVETGKSCMIRWVQNLGEYIIVSVFSSGKGTGNLPASTFELFPPSNTAVNSDLANTIGFTWNTPPQQALTFEVQTNTSAIDAGATTVAITRSSAVLIHSTVDLYVRVRSISPTFQYSSWSDWILGTPGIGGGFALPAFNTGVSKTLSSNVVSAGTDRHLIISAQTGTTDNLIEITGLGNGEECIIRAASGHIITVKHNDAGATDKIILYNGIDIALSGDSTLKLVKTSAGKVVQYVDEKGSGGSSDYINIQDQKSQNTAGGTFTSGSWQTRDLNVIVNNVGSHASLSSNQITLAVGTYRATISAPAFRVNNHQTRLQDITNSVTLLLGTVEESGAGDTIQTRSTIQGRFTLSGSTVIEVQHQCLTTGASNGYGVQGNFTTEVYTIVELVRE